MDFTYGLFVYEQAATMDFVGPMDVFVISNYLLQKGRVVTIAEKPGSLQCIGGLEVVPAATISTAPPLDVLVVPGAADMAAMDALEPQTMAWIQTQAQKNRYTTAVCSGALVLHKAGVLSHRKATTHSLHIADLKKDPTVTVLPDMRYVRDGSIVTSQGVSAGIDMALWIVGQLHTPDHARQVRKMLQYDPAPPYTAEV